MPHIARNCTQVRWTPGALATLSGLLDRQQKRQTHHGQQHGCVFLSDTAVCSADSVAFTSAEQLVGFTDLSCLLDPQAKQTAAASTASRTKVAPSASVAGAWVHLWEASAERNIRCVSICCSQYDSRRLAAAYNMEISCSQLTPDLPAETQEGGQAICQQTKLVITCNHNQPVAQPMATNAPVAQKVV